MNNPYEPNKFIPESRLMAHMRDDAEYVTDHVIDAIVPTQGSGGSRLVLYDENIDKLKKFLSESTLSGVERHIDGKGQAKLYAHDSQTVLRDLMDIMDKSKHGTKVCYVLFLYYRNWQYNQQSYTPQECSIEQAKNSRITRAKLRELRKAYKIHIANQTLSGSYECDCTV